MQGIVFLATDTASTNGDSPKIFFFKLYPVINFLSVFSTLKYFLVFSESATVPCFETMTFQGGFSRLVELWHSVFSLYLDQENTFHTNICAV